MRARPRFFLLLASMVAGVATSGVVRAEEGVSQHPMADGRLAVSIGTSAKLAFQGRWTGQLSVNPTRIPSTLRVAVADGTADTGPIDLATTRWSAGAGGFVYRDDDGHALGVRQVLLKLRRGGGTLKVDGSSTGWPAGLTQTRQKMTVTFTIGTARWCAEFKSGAIKHARGRLVARARRAPKSCGCGGDGSTFAAIQQTIFARHGCTSDACHGAALAGNLDLRPGAAYGSLVGVDASSGLQKLVQPGSKSDSFLWRKLAAATLGLTGVEGTPMPSGLPALSVDELEAIRLWIQFGAPATGVVDGTARLLNACLPPAGPAHIAPPAPPAAGEGVQLHAPPWAIPPQHEDEVCYATYYDVDALVPAGAKVPCDPFWGTDSCMVYNRTELTQEPNSHHSIIHFYRGAYDATDPGFAFQCHGGPHDGQACDPRDPATPPPAGGDCGAGGDCHGKARSSLACLTFGPPDYNLGFDPTGAGTDNAPSIGGSQQPFLRNDNPPGAFLTLPTRGIMVWNSHAFNLTDTPTSNEQWLNLYFTPAADRQFPVRGIFDSTSIFVQDVPAFESREYCRTITFGQGTRLYEFSSHTHKRGRFFRVWGPGIAASCRSTKRNPGACLPEAVTPIMVTTEYNDPALLHFTEPVVLDDPDPAARRYKFCALYDNGETNPDEVKRNSTSPMPPSFGTLAPGGPCFAPGRDTVVCLSGPKRGQPCDGDDRVCDSAPGTRDGACDACPLLGGVTTEDEMFILLGNYYCTPGSECETASYTN